TNPTGTSEGADEVFTTRNPPEFGRCVKLAKGVKGSFSTAGCTAPATPEKFSFEWQPGPGPNTKFTTKIKELMTATIETVGGATAADVIGSVLVPVATTKMAPSATLKVVGNSGKQKPEKFEGMPADNLMVAVGQAAPVQATLTLTTVQSNEEKIEINSVI